MHNLSDDFHRNKELTLLDILDGLLDKGVVVGGNIAISIADIDLIYIDLRLLITSVQSMLFRDREEFYHGAGANRPHQAEPG